MKKNDYKIKKSVLIEHVDNEYLVLDTEMNSISVINATCNEIINLIRNKKNIHDIIEHFIQKYEVDRENAKNDILEVLQNLETLGIAIKRK